MLAEHTTTVYDNREFLIDSPVVSADQITAWMFERRHRRPPGYFWFGSIPETRFAATLNSFINFQLADFGTCSVDNEHSTIVHLGAFHWLRVNPKFGTLEFHAASSRAAPTGEGHDNRTYLIPLRTLSWVDARFDLREIVCVWVEQAIALEPAIAALAKSMPAVHERLFALCVTRLMQIICRGVLLGRILIALARIVERRAIFAGYSVYLSSTRAQSGIGTREADLCIAMFAMLGNSLPSAKSCSAFGPLLARMVREVPRDSFMDFFGHGPVRTLKNSGFSNKGLARLRHLSAREVLHLANTFPSGAFRFLFVASLQKALVQIEHMRRHEPEARIEISTATAETILRMATLSSLATKGSLMTRAQIGGVLRRGTPQLLNRWGCQPPRLPKRGAPDRAQISSVCWFIDAYFQFQLKPATEKKGDSNSLDYVLDWFLAELPVLSKHHASNGWKGLARRAAIWHERLHLIDQDTPKESTCGIASWPCFLETDEDSWQQVWSTVEPLFAMPLNSGYTLMEEGSNMHHCVASYYEDCMRGTCRIFSIRFRRNGERLATLELQRRERTWDVAQVRGRNNSIPDPSIMDERGLARLGIALAKWYTAMERRAPKNWHAEFIKRQVPKRIAQHS